MKAFVTAAVAVIVVSVSAMYILDTRWQRADQAFTSPSGVRIPDHGVTHNLVGKDWYSAKEH